MTCTTWLCIIYKHRVFAVLHTCHDPIWGEVTNANFHLTLSLHEVFCGDPKMAMPRNWVVAHEVLLLCVARLSFIVHDTHAQTTFSFLTCFMSLSWSNKSCSYVGSEICFWNSLSKLMFVFAVELCISMCSQNLLQHAVEQLSSTFEAAVFSSIQTINNISVIYWCSIIMIYYNIICLCQHW